MLEVAIEGGERGAQLDKGGLHSSKLHWARDDVVDRSRSGKVEHNKKITV